MKERPVADRGDKVFLNEFIYSLKMTLKHTQSEKTVGKENNQKFFQQNVRREEFQ